MTKLNFTRRSFLASSAAALAASATPAFAFTQADAETLIGGAVAKINTIINSGKSGTAIYREFEKVLASYADVNAIARSALGPPARTASNAELTRFTKAFQKYLAAKYGARFQEFVGATIEVQSTKKVNAIYDVRCVANLQGQAPFNISFIVHERSGKFIDLQIEGISLLKSERSEMTALLDKAGGSIDGLISSL